MICQIYGPKFNLHNKNSQNQPAKKIKKLPPRALPDANIDRLAAVADAKRVGGQDNRFVAGEADQRRQVDLVLARDQPPPAGQAFAVAFPVENDETRALRRVPGQRCAPARPFAQDAGVAGSDRAILLTLQVALCHLRAVGETVHLWEHLRSFTVAKAGMFPDATQVVSGGCRFHASIWKICGLRVCIRKKVASKIADSIH